MSHRKRGAVKPGMHGAKSSGKLTDYGIQLKAKQKAKRIYGVQEVQFKNYYLKAKKLKGLVGDNLLSLLEKRLDNVLYLSGLCLSRSSAKQIIGHGHILVNDQVMDIPSYQTKVGDVISLDKKLSTKSALFQLMILTSKLNPGLISTKKILLSKLFPNHSKMRSVMTSTSI